MPCGDLPQQRGDAMRASPTSEPCNSDSLDSKPWQYVGHRRADDRELMQVFVAIEMGDSDADIAQYPDLRADFRLELRERQLAGQRVCGQRSLAQELPIGVHQRRAPSEGPALAEIEVNAEARLLCEPRHAPQRIRRPGHVDHDRSAGHDTGFDTQADTFRDVPGLTEIIRMDDDGQVSPPLS